MRDVAVVSFAQSKHVSADTQRNEVETIIPVVREAVERSGIDRAEIGFTISGSCDYLSGGPFTFVAGLDAVGAWPPINESHVEMDAAWALYEAWVVLQTGTVDSALVYGFGKSSMGDLHEIMALQSDPYYVAPLWPSMVDLAALQACAYLEETGHTEADLAEVAARSSRDARSNANAVRSGDVDAADALSAPIVAPPLRELDIAPITDGAAALVLAAGDLARQLCDRPAWIRGIDHRIDSQAMGLRDLSTSESARLAAEKAGVADGLFDIAELHTQFSHEELILADALGLADDVVRSPSGGPLAANPVMSAGLIRFGEVAARIHNGSVNRGVAHAASGPALQQNLVAVLEGN
ncbi:MAG: lipid-transfer protein [Acidimicrobiia bacterium]|nr:lipid-transfer protein [Acidimicrobiia bacterium]